MTRWSPSSWPKARMSRSIYEIQRSKKQLPKLSCSSTFQCIQIVLIDIKSLRFKAVFLDVGKFCLPQIQSVMELATQCKTFIMMLLVCTKGEVHPTVSRFQVKVQSLRCVRLEHNQRKQTMAYNFKTTASMLMCTHNFVPISGQARHQYPNFERRKVWLI